LNSSLDTSVSEGEGDVVGVIEISGISASVSDEIGSTAYHVVDSTGAVIDVDEDGDIDDDDKVAYANPFEIVSNPSVSAMIYLMGPALYLDITNTGAAIDFTSGPEFSGDYGLDGAETVGDASLDADPSATVSLVYTSDLFGVTATVGDHSDVNSAVDSALVIDVTAVEGLDLSAGVVLETLDNTLGFGASAGYSLDIASVSVGANLQGEALDVSASAGVDVGATVDVTWAASKGGASAFQYQDLIVTASSGSLVDMVTLSVTYETTFVDWGVFGKATADLGVISPYAEAGYYAPYVSFKVGAGLALIENVALDLNFSYDDADAKDSANGVVEFSAAIAY
jgi:hypothetical protein